MTLQVKWPNATDYSKQSSFCGHITQKHKKGNCSYRIKSCNPQGKKKIALLNGFPNLPSLFIAFHLL